MPFRLTDTNHTLVRVKINGKGPFNFIVDTGCPVMLIAEPVGKKIGLKTEKGWAMLDKLELEGGLELTKVKARVETPFQITGMNRMGLAGVELHGLMGYTVLAKFKMDYDYTKKQMAWTPLAFEPPAPAPLGGKAATGGMDVMVALVEILSYFAGIGPLPPPQPRGFFGFELEQKDKAVYVAKVLEKSPAAQAGLKAGDRIDAAQGKQVDSIDAVHAASQQDHRRQIAVGSPSNAIAKSKSSRSPLGTGCKVRSSASLAFSTEGAATNQPRAERSAALGNGLGGATVADRHCFALAGRGGLTNFTQGGASLCPGLICCGTFGAKQRFEPNDMKTGFEPMKRYLAVFCIAAIAPAFVHAQEEPKKKADEKIVVPFELIKTQHMVVKVKVNGKGPYRVVFDTGDPDSLVSNKIAKEAGLKDAKKPLIPLFGMMGQVKIKQIELGDLKADDISASVMDHPTITAISSVVGPLDGILGFTFYARYKMSIDYEKKQITLEPNNYKPSNAMETMVKRLSAPKTARDAANIVAPAGLLGIKVQKAKGDEAAGVLIKEVMPDTPAASRGAEGG